MMHAYNEKNKHSNPNLCVFFVLFLHFFRKVLELDVTGTIPLELVKLTFVFNLYV